MRSGSPAQLVHPRSAGVERHGVKAAGHRASRAPKQRQQLARQEGLTRPCWAAPPIQNLLAVSDGVWITNSWESVS